MTAPSGDRSAATRPRVLYTLGRDRTYHFVTGVLLVLAAVVTWLATLLSATQAQEELGSIAAGRALQFVFLFVAWGPILAWLWWLRRYVRQLSWNAGTRRLHIGRCGYLGVAPWVIAPGDIEITTAHAGVTTLPGAPLVRAPYRRIRVRGRPALILDDQGIIHDEAAVAAILAGQEPG